MALIFEISIIAARFVCSTIALLFLHFCCNVPLFARQAQSYYLWATYFGGIIGLAEILIPFLPRTYSVWMICDSISLFMFVVRAYVSRVYFSYQLRILLEHLASPQILTFAFYLPIVLAPIQGAQLAIDCLSIKYHTLIPTNDPLPDSVLLFNHQASILTLVLILIPLLGLDGFQLYLFWIGAKGLRNDVARRNAMSIVMLSFWIQVVVSVTAAIGAIIGDLWPSIIDIVIDPVLIIIICMPSVVKRYTFIFQPALNRINELTNVTIGNKDMPASTIHFNIDKSATEIDQLGAR